MQEIQFDQNAENAGLKANETASTGHDNHCLKSPGYETNHLITDKLSFYSEVLKSDRPNLSEKTWPNWDFFDFQMNLAERVLSAEKHMVLGLDAIEPADRSKISSPVGLQRAIASAFTGEAQSLWIESEICLKFDVLSRVNKQFGLLPNCYGSEPSRVGVLAEKESDQKILLRTVWSEVDTEDSSTVSHEKSKKDVAYDEFMNVFSHPAAIRIDISESVTFPTFCEFKSRFRNGDPSVTKYFAPDRPRSISLAIELLKPGSDIPEFAWWTYCLEQMAERELSHDEFDELYVKDIMRVGYSRRAIEDDSILSLTSEVAGFGGLSAVLSTLGCFKQ